MINYYNQKRGRTMTTETTITKDGMNIDISIYRSLNEVQVYLLIDGDFSDYHHFNEGLSGVSDDEIIDEAVLSSIRKYEMEVM